ncbi:hypothetical protein Tco_0708369 [Tanacetum coccineum]
MDAYDLGIFKGISLQEDGANLSLLQYAGDALFFGEWSLHNAQNLIRILKCFQNVSGLAINLTKSTLYGIGVHELEVASVAAAINCKSESLPFMYLGLPVGKNMTKVENWILVVDRFHTRLFAWKPKLLLIGGRLTLTKAVLGSLPLFYLSLFRAPVKVINMSIRRRFFWGFKEGKKGISWVKWESTLARQHHGGLGIGSIKAKNLSLLGKWWWRFLNEEDALWCRVVKAIHGPKCNFSTQVGEGLCRETWESIIRSGSVIDKMSIPFKKSFSKRTGDGNDTLFWKDVWVNEGVCLKDRFPRLFTLESNKDCKLSERWCQVNGVWSGAWNWRALPRGRGVDELTNLIDVVGPLTLTEDSRDGWKWNLDPSSNLQLKDYPSSLTRSF